MHYVVALVAVLGIAVIGGQLMLLVPEGLPSTGVTVPWS
jgi:hypothetical protein